MPSAASVKVDKQVPLEGALADATGNGAPIRQVTTLVEHKIRNLEKRKSRLDTYRDLQTAGKELQAEQKTAVAKYNEVTQTLDFARDLYKQILGIMVASEKEAKKQAKKEATIKSQAELARLREILLVQDALVQMRNEPIREDFLHGKNGAPQLVESDLKLLDELYPAVTPKHQAGNPTAFTNDVQAAAEHLLAAVDGKQKEVFGGSYSHVKEILGKIHESGYFDQVYDSAPEPTEVVEPEAAVIPEPEPLPAMEMIPIEVIAPQLIQKAEPPVALEASIAPEQPMFYPPQPQPPQPRPITEMLETGSFFFLQESEIDTPEQIPTQTFTNPNFSSQAPMPLPIFQSIPGTLPPQAMPGNNGIEEHKDELKGQAGGRPRQNYFPNNNGYTNRPRPRNNGPRQGNNRH